METLDLLDQLKELVKISVTTEDKMIKTYADNLIKYTEELIKANKLAWPAPSPRQDWPAPSYIFKDSITGDIK